MKKLGELAPLVATLDRTAALLWGEAVTTTRGSSPGGRSQMQLRSAGYGAGVTGRRISQINQRKFRVLTTRQRALRGLKV
jgi:hypothetical protein